MKNSCLFLCVFAMACARGGSVVRDAGGGATGLAGSGGAAGADGSQSGADAAAGSGGGAQTTTSNSNVAIGGGAMVSSGSAMGGSSAMTAAGRTSVGGGIIAGSSAVGGDTGTACWVRTAFASRTTADLLLLLDRSESMTNDIAEDCMCAGTLPRTRCRGTSCTDRWSTVASAISTAIAATPNVHWGLKLFYSPVAAGSAGDARAADNHCQVSAEVEVPIGTDSGPAILSKIQATIPAGNTPTRAAIQAASAYLKSLTDPNGKYILLATDGPPNCPIGGRDVNVSDFDETAKAISEAGFPVYVLGIGPSVYDLQTFAVVAGTGHYYAATSPDELTSALSAITETVATCTFTLSESPPTAGKMSVAIDQTVLPKDDNNGWSFASATRTIVLHGDACTKLKAITASTLKVQIDCP